MSKDAKSTTNAALNHAALIYFFFPFDISANPASSSSA